MRKDYGWLDRTLHRLAFAWRAPQLGIADLERRLYRSELLRIDLLPPIFITALPRAGTTILLEILAKTKTIATHRYRDMPFVLSPMLWDRMSSRFRKSDAPRERAHQDGIQISSESPEAFEEMVWHAFFRERYRGDHITPWRDCDNEEFREFFVAHMRKIVALRAREKATACRYASKNNLNMCRIPVLLDSFERAQVIVPFRDPLQHAASLLRQHLRFLEAHRTDPFARRYMLGIGHYDFGDHLRPIDFDGRFAGRSVEEARGIAFWLEYWVHSYRHVLAQIDQERLSLIGFEAMGSGADLAPLASQLGIEVEDLRTQAAVLKPAKGHDPDLQDVPADLVRSARDLHADLLEHCLLR